MATFALFFFWSENIYHKIWLLLPWSYELSDPCKKCDSRNSTVTNMALHNELKVVKKNMNYNLISCWFDKKLGFFLVKRIDILM